MVQLAQGLRGQAGQDGECACRAQGDEEPARAYGLAQRGGQCQAQGGGQAGEGVEQREHAALQAVGHADLQQGHEGDDIEKVKKEKKYLMSI